MLRRLTADQQRNVRHWGMEFVVVVAGVLLALWLQQWGERRHAMQDMAVAEDAIHDELRETLKNLIWREAIGQCHVDRAELLKSMLLADGSPVTAATQKSAKASEAMKARTCESISPLIAPASGPTKASSLGLSVMTSAKTSLRIASTSTCCWMASVTLVATAA